MSFRNTALLATVLGALIPTSSCSEAEPQVEVKAQDGDANLAAIRVNNPEEVRLLSPISSCLSRSGSRMYLV